MNRRLPQLFAVTLVLVCAAFVTPSALAGSGKPKHQKKASDCGVSASCVYVEHVPTGGGAVAAGSDAGPPVQTTKKVSKAIDRALAHHAKQAQVLQNLVTNPGLGATRVRFVTSSEQMVAPSVLGATFDLGTGPLTLFAVLLAGALLMAGGMAVRHRARSRVPARTEQ